MKNKVLFIVGPTAVGKTSLSIQLAQEFNGEIISGDSMQVYKNLNIGTAKVTPKEMAGVTHHLIDIRSVDQRYSVADFCKDAQEQITLISKKNKLPIVVGGTGFYIQALLYGLKLGDDHYQNDQIRRELDDYAEKHGDTPLWKKLKEIDPQAAQKIPSQNRRRVIRAIEVYKNTGKKFSEQHDKLIPQYDSFMVGLNTDRHILYQRINQRVDLMMKAGLLNEAQWLYQQGSVNLPAGKGIGYREFDPYFKNQISLPQAIEKVKQDSRHYAKRQLTWFRNKLNVNWYDIVKHPNQVSVLKEAINKWIN